jgi:hypothetical protein
MADSGFSHGCCVRAANRYSRQWALFGVDVESLQGCSRGERMRAETVNVKDKNRFTTMGLQLSL